MLKKILCLVLIVSSLSSKLSAHSNSTSVPLSIANKFLPIVRNLLKLQNSNKKQINVGMRGKYFQALDGLPKIDRMSEMMMMEEKDKNTSSVTWPLDNILSEKSFALKIIKLVLTFIVFKKIVIFIGLFSLMFFIPALTGYNKIGLEEEDGKMEERSSSLLESNYKVFLTAINKFSS
jgi:hypothetical protein